MTTQQLAEWIPLVIAGLLALALVIFLLALYQLRRGRTAEYWRLRRDAGVRGGRLLLLSVALFGLAIALGIFTGAAALAVNRVGGLLGSAADPQVAAAGTSTGVPEPAATEAVTASPEPSATATATPTVTPTPTFTATPTPTMTPTVTPTATPTPTATVTPTPTATYETALQLETPPGGREASEDAVLRILSADTGVSPNGTPLDPREVFPAGAHRVYLFFTFRGMDNGAVWSRLLYRDGALLQGSSQLWSLGSEGSSYFFFGQGDGFTPGQYQVEIRLGDRVVTEFSFALTSAP